MKSIHLLTWFAVIMVADSVGAEAEPSVYGRWLTDDRSGVIQIEPCGATICGTLVRVLDPTAPTHDINNPDPKLRIRPLVGMTILSGLKRADGRWRGGQAYDPKAGRIYRAAIAVGPSARLNVTGCILFLCQTRHWTRIAGEPGK
ncbi:DUF2147 domain-containing protein [Novosphingobium sp.]